MSDEREDLEAVQERLREIQSRKRGGIRWSMSRHTAEMAIDAIVPKDERRQLPRSGKSRRRKRKKRLL